MVQRRQRWQTLKEIGVTSLGHRRRILDAIAAAAAVHRPLPNRTCALQCRCAARKREHGVGFLTRMGINSGEVVVGRIGDDLRMDYTAQGHTVGLAQRMIGEVALFARSRPSKSATSLATRCCSMHGCTSRLRMHTSLPDARLLRSRPRGHWRSSGLPVRLRASWRRPDACITLNYTAIH